MMVKPETKTEWPSSGPDYNSWHLDLARFMAILEDAKEEGYWTFDWDLKYLTIRIDTRDNGWLLYVDNRDSDGDAKTRIYPERVIAAIEENRKVFKGVKTYARMRGNGNAFS